MVYEVRTTLAPDEVLDRAERFFSQRVPLQAAFPEQRGAGYLVLRGQGGEEIALAARGAPGATDVRGSTLFFDHALERFLSTLPAPAAP
jgi:hypothetical protein